MLPIPKKLLKQGVRDMLRISRRAHERHELRRVRAARRAGGVRRRAAGARADRRPHQRRRAEPAASTLEVPTTELARRRAAWKPPPPRFERGYGGCSRSTSCRPNEGCDFDFLRTEFGGSPRGSRISSERGRWGSLAAHHKPTNAGRLAVSAANPSSHSPPSRTPPHVRSSPADPDTAGSPPASASATARRPATCVPQARRAPATPAATRAHGLPAPCVLSTDAS